MHWLLLKDAEIGLDRRRFNVRSVEHGQHAQNDSDILRKHVYSDGFCIGNDIAGTDGLARVLLEEKKVRTASFTQATQRHDRGFSWTVVTLNGNF